MFHFILCFFVAATESKEGEKKEAKKEEDSNENAKEKEQRLVNHLYFTTKENEMLCLLWGESLYKFNFIQVVEKTPD